MLAARGVALSRFDLARGGALDALPTPVPPAEAALLTRLSTSARSVLLELLPRRRGRGGAGLLSPCLLLCGFVACWCCLRACVLFVLLLLAADPATFLLLGLGGDYLPSTLLARLGQCLQSTKRWKGG